MEHITEFDPNVNPFLQIKQRLEYTLNHLKNMDMHREEVDEAWSQLKDTLDEWVEPNMPKVRVDKSRDFAAKLEQTFKAVEEKDNARKTEWYKKNEEQYALVKELFDIVSPALLKSGIHVELTKCKNSDTDNAVNIWLKMGKLVSIRPTAPSKDKILYERFSQNTFKTLGEASDYIIAKVTEV